MWLRCLGFALLVWIPAVLHAHLNCSVPDLKDGYFIPTEKSYPNGKTVIYSCDKRHKPVVEGWWATSTCQNGKWVHEPKCIDETACILPTIPNAKPSQVPKGWYKDGTSMPVYCKEGYETEGSTPSYITCINGNWTSLPVCGKSSGGCTKPPKSPDAVIIDQQYEEVFPHGSSVRYQCRQGYAMAGGKTEASILCTAGNWQAGEVCKASTGSTSKDKETSPFTTIDRCGAFPVVKDGDFIPDGQRSLKFQCALHYKLVGPETVVCYSNRQWSEVPTCRENYCSVNTEEYTDLENIGVKYIPNGYTEKLNCVNRFNFRNYALVECNDGIPKISRCCNKAQINLGIC
ncbi:complement factor H-like isoform X2 [Melanotaenia boesemani]|uniref:complement factor H-like isoform X2 n=1 Tax=Melanotaenia boesemani TaxID=1250792 RepID=UPI001C0540A4|nr:complement factor H-like isoform X2 [Melanotaenia boesemani]